jgi:hypothetical protein
VWAQTGSVAPREPYPGHSEGKPYRPTTDQDFFWKPEPVTRMHSSPQPDNCGVGLILGVHSETGTVLIQGMMPGSAAARSGLLKIDDVIAEVDGINVSSCRLPIDVVESLIHGRQVTCFLLSCCRIACLSMQVAVHVRHVNRKTTQLAGHCLEIGRGAC